MGQSAFHPGSCSGAEPPRMPLMTAPAAMSTPPSIFAAVCILPYSMSQLLSHITSCSLLPLGLRDAKSQDAHYTHLQASAQLVIVAHKSIYSSPDAEKFGCAAGGRHTEFPSSPLLLKAFSCATHAYRAPAAVLAAQNKGEAAVA